MKGIVTKISNLSGFHKFLLVLLALVLLGAFTGSAPKGGGSKSSGSQSQYGASVPRATSAGLSPLSDPFAMPTRSASQEKTLRTCAACGGKGRLETRKESISLGLDNPAIPYTVSTLCSGCGGTGVR